MDTGPLSPDNYTAEAVARLLQLEPLEHEGGYYRRTAESDLIQPGTGRRAYSIIYYLLTPSGFSALHKLGTDETWSFHAGDTLESLRLAPDGSARIVRLGLQVDEGEQVLSVIPANIWQGTKLAEGGRWALVSCFVAPEFRWSDFTLGDYDALVKQYPSHAKEIRALVR
jgi:predicted cupin superfamily sugar epimerase